MAITLTETIDAIDGRYLDWERAAVSMRMSQTFRPTRQQAQFLESADWFFGLGPRRSGRSTAAAMIALGQAMRGQCVYLFDPSLVFSYGMHHHVHSMFAQSVMRVAQEYFPDHEFQFDRAEHRLSYVGPNYTRLPEGF